MINSFTWTKVERGKWKYRLTIRAHSRFRYPAGHCRSQIDTSGQSSLRKTKWSPGIFLPRDQYLTCPSWDLAMLYESVLPETWPCSMRASFLKLGRALWECPSWDLAMFYESVLPKTWPFSMRVFFPRLGHALGECLSQDLAMLYESVCPETWPCSMTVSFLRLGHALSIDAHRTAREVVMSLLENLQSDKGQNKVIIWSFRNRGN